MESVLDWCVASQKDSPTQYPVAILFGGIDSSFCCLDITVLLDLLQAKLLEYDSTNKWGNTWKQANLTLTILIKNLNINRGDKAI